MMLHKNNSFTYLKAIFALSALGACSYSIVPSMFIIDWDTLMYAINVRIHMAGDNSFSYMHNLIKEYILLSFNILRTITGAYNPVASLKYLTWISMFASSVLLYFSLRKVTGNAFISFSGALFWMIVPGNIFLAHTYEDNIWAVPFLSLFLFSCISIDASVPSEKCKFYGWIILAATSLALGINIHQQLALLFYLFTILIFTHYRLSLSVKFICFLLFCTWYFLLSIIINQSIYGQLYSFESVVRLYHNPYASNFPELWFFSSGKTFPEWITLIYRGWCNTLLLNGKHIPIIYFFFLFTGLFMIPISIIQKTDAPYWKIHKDTLLRLLWISPTFLVFIPYSLLYEPQIVERWDSALPGLTILLFLSVHFILSIHITESRTGRVVLKILKHSLGIFMIITLIQTFNFAMRNRERFTNDPTNIYRLQIESFLKQSQYLDKSILLLSQGFRKWDTDSRILLDFPSLQIITLQNETLHAISSSYPLQNTTRNLKQPVTKSDFPADTHFIMTPGVHDDIETLDPEFLTRYCIDVVSLD